MAAPCALCTRYSHFLDSQIYNINLQFLLMATFTFRKPEHLCKQKEIEALFSAGSQSFTAYPLRATFKQVEPTTGPAVKVLLSVAKRRLHHAVDRNRAKRQLREAYRLQKHLLLQACHRTQPSTSHSSGWPKNPYARPKSWNACKPCCYALPTA